MFSSPVRINSGSCYLVAVYKYTDLLLDSLQGFVVALTFCYRNGEVSSDWDKQKTNYRIGNCFWKEFVRNSSLNVLVSNSSIEQFVQHILHILEFLLKSDFCTELIRHVFLYIKHTIKIQNIAVLTLNVVRINYTLWSFCVFDASRNFFLSRYKIFLAGTNIILCQLNAETCHKKVISLLYFCVN